MHHVGKPVRGEQRSGARAVGDVALLEAKSGERRKLFKPRALQGRIIIGVEIVEADHGAALLQQPVHHVIPDESWPPP